MNPDVLVIGAGLAGLCCARSLHRQGVSALILEAGDAPGGRVRTDRVEGFLLDRGFQTLLTSYPEAQASLDFSALQLRPFRAGALVRFGGRFHTLSDPWRNPFGAARTLFSPIGSFADKIRVARLRSECLRGRWDDGFHSSETTTLQALRDRGFSQSMMDRFFRPFLGGVFLDADLETSSRMFRFVFRMFSQGEACLPAEGMEAIPRQLASALPADSIRYGAKVTAVQPGSVRLESGEILYARTIVVATEAPVAATLLHESAPTTGQAVTCLYFACPIAPLEQPMLVLNGEGHGPINNLCMPTAVAPSYGPHGQSLVSVTVLGQRGDHEKLRVEVLEQLNAWFGSAVRDWRHLRTYTIPYALPRQSTLAPPERPVRAMPGLFVCGDHRDNASIQGAMVSGRRAAEAILAEPR